MEKREVPLSHPGEILLEEWLKPLNISQYALAKAIDVPPRRINEIVKGKRSITPDTALRLATFFGTDAQSWINLQSHYDLRLTSEQISPQLNAISPFVFA
ncbi:addiction module antidote protein, HigA family [Canicola haemoglobinophilus]|uniref:Plasmid maintenance system antidote protein, XRE family/addiction module antidote protein, HigA family/PSEEN1946 proteic killer active protein n=1 Tax=Canicola haemoglobinophilus TaxID=733 RepID=A0A1V4B261_9PAST|nr:HigA family addiction module antitoxin [Canicola haemoglobinophilus]OOS01283.1 addiction module antidote protein, HigA family [Canicola haemoglobinophilus]STO60129.1 plasmid maintenance system antidote protein, XRE family/addiction module antidote protein, HigA family/PSEEN1946 proteic killer active protein [Canicola haemoglobinophilus]